MPHARELHDVVASARLDEVERFLSVGDDVNQRGPNGVTALHVAAAGGHAALPSFLAAPFDIDIGAIAPTEAQLGSAHAAVAELLVQRGADKDAAANGGMTPLMVAAYFGRKDVAAVLKRCGANQELRDARGRTAARLGIFQTMLRAIEFCGRVPAIASASLAQVYFPANDRYTTVLGLALTSPLPPDAFAGWPEDEPIAVVGLGGPDPLSTLLPRATIYVRSTSTSTSTSTSGNEARRADDAREAEMITRIATQAAALAERLAARIGGTCTVYTPPGLPPVGYPETTRINCELGESRATVFIFWSDEATGDEATKRMRTLQARAGLRGAQGWQGDIENIDDAFEPIAAAVATALRTLTGDSLVVGRRYRVHARNGSFEPGMIVTYRGPYSPDRGEEGPNGYDFTWPNGTFSRVDEGTEIDLFLETAPET